MSTSYRIEKITQRFLWIQQQKKETLQRLKEIRKEETHLEKEIKDYLTQNKEDGIQVDSQTVIFGKALTKNIRVSQKDLEDRIRLILEDEGLEDPDETLKKILKSKKGSKQPVTKIQVKQVT